MRSALVKSSKLEEGRREKGVEGAETRIALVMTLPLLLPLHRLPLRLLYCSNPVSLLRLSVKLRNDDKFEIWRKTDLIYFKSSCENKASKILLVSCSRCMTANYLHIPHPKGR